MLLFWRAKWLGSLRSISSIHVGPALSRTQAGYPQHASQSSCSSETHRRSERLSVQLFLRDTQALRAPLSPAVPQRHTGAQSGCLVSLASLSILSVCFQVRKVTAVLCTSPDSDAAGVMADATNFCKNSFQELAYQRGLRFRPFYIKSKR
jgi:hypothetical protein